MTRYLRYVVIGVVLATGLAGSAAAKPCTREACSKVIKSCRKTTCAGYKGAMRANCRRACSRTILHNVCPNHPEICA
ncbi:MAG TPA: hypothetical protein VMS22_26420 [Candidatus Eisenbacteria bacterium]|nr:hypothetical protein [Candidatus Eisenbacteria bacterium]